MLDLPRPIDAARVFVLRLGAFGDILRTLPAVRALRSGLPGARLEWIVDDRWASVLADDDEIDSVLALPRGDWRRTIGHFRNSLRRRKSDLLIDFHGNLRSGVVGWMSGAPVRIGYTGHQSKELNRVFTTHRLPSGARRISRVERNLDLVRALGIDVAGVPRAKLALPRRGAARAARLHADLGRRAFALINPGSSAAQPGKRPPAEALAMAARTVAERGLLPLVVWGPGERDDARRVVDLADDPTHLAPATNLSELAALLELATLFVGGDSGPLHLACAVGCPVVGLYGPTDPVVNGPWGVAFRVVHAPGPAYTGIKRVDRRRGFEGLEPAQAAQAVAELLDERDAQERVRDQPDR